ncbi:uncharacterized protein BJX67DRAFT_282341 [Aspergillus lucknowensis]|uniref:Uncharacterized protein n=1 Tax=Aspergillus lucknowensis TaxID=176173 RepID=A0ABR4M0S8_9EURO
MPKHSTINNTVFPNSSPAITRSQITSSTLSNLSHADRIHRSSLSSVTVIKNPHSAPKETACLKRCVVANSTLSHTTARRCKVNGSTLHNVRAARSLQATNSTLDDVSSMRRVNVVNSTVTNHSAMARSEASDSVVSASAIYRSTLEKSRVVNSRVKKSRLRDCEVSDCVILNTDFRGMVLRNGVWKNGKLVGSCGETVVALSQDGKKVDLPTKVEENPEVWMQGLASETWSSDCDDSDSDEETEDLPPPYKP